MNNFDNVPFANFFLSYICVPVCGLLCSPFHVRRAARGALPKRGLCSLHGYDHCLKAGWLEPGAGQGPDLRGNSGLGIIVG